MIIKWFKKKVISWVKDDWNSVRSECVPSPTTLGSNSPLREFGNGVQLSIFKANGGYVVEFTTYDRKKDETIRNLHLINSEEDIGDKLSKIITYETLLR
jgi:hypothetical protein